MRDAYIHLSEAGQDGAPLIVTLHGTGGDEHQFAPLARQLLPDAHILSPRGDVSEHGANRFFRRTGEGVYDMDDLARATGKLAAFVTAHTARTQAPRVIGLGYSNGANILASVSFSHPEVFGDLILMHPLIPFTPAAQPGLRGTRVLLTAGRRDPICPAALTERLTEWYDRQGADTELVWHGGGHEVAQSERAAIAGFLSGAPLQRAAR